MNDTLKSIWNYVLSGILLIAGFLFLIMYAKSSGLEKQPVEMLYGSLFMIMAGVIALPIVATRIRKGVATLVAGLAVLCAGFLIYTLVTDINKEIDFQAAFTEYGDVTKQRLVDIRAVQEEYRKVNGVFASEWDTLIQFVNTPAIPKVLNIGGWDLRRVSATDTIRDGSFQEYFDLGLVISKADMDSIASLESERLGHQVSSEMLAHMMNDNQTNYRVQDTSYVTFYEEYFRPELREAQGLPVFELAELPYNPHPKAEGAKFILRTGLIESGEAGLKLPVIEVKDSKPFGRLNVKRDTLMFGSLIEAKTDGNWSRKK